MNALTSLFSLLIFPAGLTLILFGMFYEWIDRKLVARFQNRVGPRWFQPFADTVKLLGKEQIIPSVANPFLFFGLPMVAITGALTAASYVPLIGFAPSQLSRRPDRDHLSAQPVDSVHRSGRLEYKQPFFVDRRDACPDPVVCLRSTLFTGFAWARRWPPEAGRSA